MKAELQPGTGTILFEFCVISSAFVFFFSELLSDIVICVATLICCMLIIRCESVNILVCCSKIIQLNCVYFCLLRIANAGGGVVF